MFTLTPISMSVITMGILLLFLSKVLITASILERYIGLKKYSILIPAHLTTIAILIPLFYFISNNIVITKFTSWQIPYYLIIFYTIITHVVVANPNQYCYSDNIAERFNDIEEDGELANEWVKHYCKEHVRGIMTVFTILMVVTNITTLFILEIINKG